MPNVLTTMHQSSSLVHKTSVNYQPILGSFFTDQNSAGCCSSNGEGYGNHKSHSTPWKLLNSVLKGSLVIEACRITTISMAKLMQQNTQFQLSKIMPGPWKEFENFDLMGKFCWNLTPKTCGTKAAKGSNDQLFEHIKGCFSKQNGKNIYNILVVSVHIFSPFTKVWDRV